MTTPTELRELADRIEREGFEGAERWVSAWEAVNPEPECVFYEWMKARGAFFRLLDASAYLSAADALKPDGWEVADAGHNDGIYKYCLRPPLWPHRVKWQRGAGPTMAGAMAAAALRAHAVTLENTK